MSKNTLIPTKKHIGHYRYGWYLWELITNLDLNLNQIAEIQEQNGYPLNPYGFYTPKKFKRTYKSGKTKYRYTWQCATSSD